MYVTAELWKLLPEVTGHRFVLLRAAVTEKTGGWEITLIPELSNLSMINSLHKNVTKENDKMRAPRVPDYAPRARWQSNVRYPRYCEQYLVQNVL